jgi:hypothetical protein
MPYYPRIVSVSDRHQAVLICYGRRWALGTSYTGPKKDHNIEFYSMSLSTVYKHCDIIAIHWWSLRVIYGNWSNTVVWDIVMVDRFGAGCLRQSFWWEAASGSIVCWKTLFEKCVWHFKGYKPFCLPVDTFEWQRYLECGRPIVKPTTSHLVHHFASSLLATTTSPPQPCLWELSYICNTSP